MPTEQQIQAACVLWFWNTYPQYRMRLHCNNNNSFNRVAGNIAKSMGVVAGVSDMELLWDGGRVIFIEFKTEKGTQSEEQKKFADMCIGLGHMYLVIHSLNEFKKLICQVIGQ